jgi:predicted alpha/beta hydrolase family esterase
MPDSAQAVFIDGGMTFEKRDEYLEYLKEREVSLEEEEKWYKGDYLPENLEADFVELDMPCSDNAKYEDWKITFEKYLPLLEDQIVLIGFSLGGIFLAKYLSENEFPKNIISLNLVAPPFDDSLPEEDLAGGFELPEDISVIREKAGKTRLFFSKDDNVVPVSHAEKYREKLENPETNIYKDKEGHFQAKKFPELIQKINQDLKT